MNPLNPLQEARKFLGSAWKEYNRIFREALRGRIPLLNIILRYILRHRGKELRPLLTMLVGRIYRDPLPERVIRSAVLVELLHNATLVHDDVIDVAWRRRSVFTIHYLWGTRIAVLVGDFLLARGLLLALDHHAYEELQLLSRAVRAMSEGELLQAQHARDLSWTEKIYLEVIRLKTASLLAVCFSLGALSAGAPPSDVDTWYQVGENVGIAFQITDDLLDWEPASRKDLHQDLSHGILTLPVIYTLHQLPVARKHRMLWWIQQVRTHPEALERIRELLQEYQAMEYARRVARNFLTQAMHLLDPWKHSSSYPYLRSILEYIGTRQT